MTLRETKPIASNKLVVFLLLMLGAVLVYAPALNGELLWDDLYLVGENPFYKSPVFALEVFKHYLYLDSISLYYRPVQNLSYIFDYWLWHGSAFGYHLGNALLHGLASCVLYGLLRALLTTLRNRDEKESDRRDSLIAFGVALLWVVHPIHNAAVAYVAGRADSLATIFAAGAWLAYLRGLTSKWRGPLNMGAGLLLLTALCAKEIAFIWMALFAAHLFLFEYRVSLRQKLVALAGILGVLALYLGLRAWPVDRPAVPGAAHSGLSERVLLMLRALGDYVSLIFWPGDLHMDRIIYTVNTYKDAHVWMNAIRFEYLSMIGLAALGVLGWMSFLKLPGQRMRVFGMLWFVVGFLPISNLFPLNAQAAEHWIYMPSMGLLLFLAGCVCAAPPWWQKSIGVLVFLGVLPLGLRTARRSYDWADAERFYKQTIAAGGGTPRVHLNLALIYTKRGQDEAAEKILREAVHRFPDYATARINLGICLVKLHKTAEAEQYLNYNQEQSQTLAKTYPHTWSAALNIAKIRYEAKDKTAAMNTLDAAIKLHPEIWELIAFKAQIFKELGKLPEAICAVQTYASSYWWHYESHMMLGRLELEQGDADQALQVFADAARLDLWTSEPFSLMARVNLQVKRPQQAYEAQVKAIRRNPDQPSQFLLLSTILEELNRPQEARAALRHAEDLANAARANGAVL